MTEADPELGPPIACTIATRSDLPAARVLARSFRTHHPDHELVVLLLDGVPEPDAGPDHRVVGADWLVTDETDYPRMATALSASELANAMKPLLLRRLLGRHEVVTYLDPEMGVFAPFPELWKRAATHDILITPRLLEPPPTDGKEPGGPSLSNAGTFEPGFIVVGQGAEGFLDLWAQRARRGPMGSAQTLRFAEPWWVDQVPALFRHEVLDDPGIDVAYWNLHERPLAVRSDGTITAAGEPLRIFHFNGHRPEQPWLLSTHCQHRPRILLSEHPVVRTLCESYRESLHAAGYQDSVPYGFGSLPDGTRLTAPMRQLFRSEWMRAEHSDQEVAFRREPVAVPPHPFGADDGAAFQDWLSSPSSIGERAAGMNRLTMWVWSTRTDLQVAFPKPLGANAAEFRRWCHADGKPEVPLPTWALPREPAPLRDPDDQFGVNIAGYLTAELGLGEMARIIHRVVEQAAIPVVSVVEEQSIACRTALPPPETVGQPRFPVSILAVNADFTELLLASHPEVGHRRYRIGLWSWELEDFPAWLHDAFPLVDEVWTTSEFTRRAIARHAPVPVKAIPVPILDPGESRPAQRSPDRPVRFFFSFDFNSTAQRKNPLGLVTAFQRAFPGRRDVSLVIKAINGHLHAAAAERLRLQVGADDRIELVERYLSVEELHDLYASSDAYVSLHRSEGFGLTVAEAMVRGMPVIATNYSGTTEFFDDSVGWSIPYRLVEVGPGSHPYHADAVWADPDLDEAAKAMRAVADNPAEAARRGRAARDRVLRTRSVQTAADWMRGQIDNAYRAWQTGNMVGSLIPASTHELTRPLEQARKALHWRPDARTPSRVPLAPLLRRAVLRMIDHYDVHQRRVMGAMVAGMHDALNQVGHRLDDATDAADAQANRSDSIEADLGRRLDALAQQLDRIERRLAEREGREGRSR